MRLARVEENESFDWNLMAKRNKNTLWVSRCKNYYSLTTISKMMVMFCSKVMRTDIFLWVLVYYLYNRVTCFKLSTLNSDNCCSDIRWDCGRPIAKQASNKNGVAWVEATNDAIIGHKRLQKLTNKLNHELLDNAYWTQMMKDRSELDSNQLMWYLLSFLPCQQHYWNDWRPINQGGGKQKF